MLQPASRKLEAVPSVGLQAQVHKVVGRQARYVEDVAEDVVGLAVLVDRATAAAPLVQAEVVDQEVLEPAPDAARRGH